MRHCLGQQPFKYFVETDPTVPQWVKTITEEDIENWNSVLNKQNSFSAGRALSFNGNTLDFDYYVNTGGSDNSRLLTKDNIEILCNSLLRENIQDEFSRLMQYAINDEIKNFVNTKISALNINSFLSKLTFTNKMTDIENTLNNLQGVVNETNISIGGKQDTLSVIGDGLVFKSPHDYDGSQQDTTNKILSLGLDIWDDAHSNEYYKDEYRTERGYNGDDFGNLVHFHYKDTDNKIYLAVPFSKRLMYEDVAISSKAILNELNLNYEMKLATLEGNVNFVDLDYYKNKWGVTGDNFTKDDYKTLLKEWYNIELDANDPNNQTLINFYSYDGHNDKYYGRQRAIVINLSEENEIYPAVEWVAIQNASEENFNARTVSWWYSDTIDGVKNFLSEDDEYPGNNKYYWIHGDISAKTKIPSVDAVAKYAARGLSITQGTTSNTFDINLLNYAETTLDTINANLNFDSTNRKVQIKSGNTLLSEVQLTDWVTKDTEQIITGKKTFNTDIYVNNNKGLKYSITGGGVTVERYMIAKDNVERIIVGNSSDALQFQSSSTRPAYNGNDQIALLSDVTSLPEPMIFKGTIGSSGTIEWSNLDSASASNKGWTYKVITDHNTAPICKAGDTIISDSTTWVVIPSGDEPSGTVTNVAIQGETNYIEVSGSPITSSGTITITAGQTIKNKRDLPTTLTTFSGSVAENTNYILSTAISSLTISSIANNSLESNIIFEVTGSSFSITFPANTPMIGDEPTYESGEKYIVSICNGIVIVAPITA